MLLLLLKLKKSCTVINQSHEYNNETKRKWKFFFNLPEYEAFMYVFKFPGAVELTESESCAIKPNPAPACLVMFPAQNPDVLPGREPRPTGTHVHGALGLWLVQTYMCCRIKYMMDFKYLT